MKFTNFLYLVFRQGEPFFEEYRAFAKQVKVVFRNNKTAQTLDFKLGLRKDDSHWYVFQYESLVYQGIIKKKINQLIEKSNNAIKQGQNFDIGETINNWHFLSGLYDENYVELIPTLENINPLPTNSNQKSVVLTYQNGQPIFMQEDKIGILLWLEFGECWRADREEAVLNVSIEIKWSKSGWVTRLRSSEVNDSCDWYLLPGKSKVDEYVRYKSTIGNHYLEQELKILELVNECNQAIHNSQCFDFSPYEKFWKQWDENFKIYVPANILFLND